MSRDGDMEELDDGTGGITFSLNRNRPRSDSTATPPAPPPFFNPPADVPIAPSEAITPPAGSALSPGSADTSMSISQQLDHADVRLAIAAAVSAGHARPQLRALQRVSNDSIKYPHSMESSASSTGSGTSDSGLHLIEARNSLLNEGVSSGEPSRSNSESDGFSGRGHFEVHVTNPTPPLQPAELADLNADLKQKSTSPLRDEEVDRPAEQLWDSVWPAPGTVVRPPIPPEPNRSHFPTAPMSPFVTPDFSPAIIASSSLARKPSSPTYGPVEPGSPSRRSHSPSPLGPQRNNRSPSITAQISPGEGNSLTRSRSCTSSSSPLLSHSPITASPITITKHSRSQSGSSTSLAQRHVPRDSLDRIHPTPPAGTPPTSPPPSSPVRNPSLLVSPLLPESGNNSTNDMIRKAHLPPVVKSTDRISEMKIPPTQTLYPASRPRGKSLSSIRPSQITPPDIKSLVKPRDSPKLAPTPTITEEDVPHLPEIPSSTLPPISLPPPVTNAPVLPVVNPGEDGIPPSDMTTITNHHSFPPPLFAPLARPAVLRRAISDYDAKAKTSPSLTRSLSITSDLDKSPKRPSSSAELTSPMSPRLGGDLDMTRVKKSPRRSPMMIPSANSLATVNENSASQREDSASQREDYPLGVMATPMPASHEWHGDIDMADHIGSVDLVDEGDVLPNVDFEMDVTFDDEGLNTLERIFLLTKSDFPFHRAYVARVLGDLLYEIDPCETVEYILPLLAGFSMDDDDSVKEAFASELHRILWYFFSNCRIVEDPDEGNLSGVEYSPQTETVTVTSEGVNVVPKPDPTDVAANEVVDPRVTAVAFAAGPASGSSGAPSRSTPSSVPFGDDTPATTMSDTPSSIEMLITPPPMVSPFSDDIDPEKTWANDSGPLVDRPTLPVNFFTPLLGTLLLSMNTTTSDSIRRSMVHMIGRLRRKVPMDPQTWGQGATDVEPDERKMYLTQNGPHSHDLRPFDQASRTLVETELLQGIIVGMGQLSTELPEGLFSGSPEDGQHILDSYAEFQSPKMRDAVQTGDMDQADIFREQLVAEADAGRATSMNLIGSLCEYYTGEELVNIGFVHEVLRTADGDALARAEGAIALNYLAKGALSEHVQPMIDLFETLMLDDVDHVRQSICVALPTLCKRIDSPDYRRSFAVKAVKILTESGEDVRFAALEVLGDVIYSFIDDSRGPPAELLEIYTADTMETEDEDGLWDVVASFNFPGVCLTLGPDRWNELRNLYIRLQARAGDKIMRLLAVSLHDVAKVLPPDQVEVDLLPVYKRCLTEHEEIREYVFTHADVILSRVNADLGWTLFQDLATAWKDGNLGGWRAREQLALHLPSFFETFSTQSQGECLLEMMRNALLDPFAAVRDAVTTRIPRLYNVLGLSSNLAKRFHDVLLDLSDSSLYRQRVTFVRCIREFIKPPPNRSVFEEFFLPSLPRLSQDVVDVRIALAQTIADLLTADAYYTGEDEAVPPPVSQLARALYDDDSMDVRDTMRNVDLNRLAKGKGLPYTIDTTRPPTRDESFGRQVPAKISGSQSNTTIRASPPRRPSAEFAARMGTMQLGKDPRDPSGEVDAEELESPTPGGLKSDTAMATVPDDGSDLDPFSISFSRASADAKPRSSQQS